MLLLYLVHLCAVLVWSWTHAANIDEWAHLAAGLDYVSSRRLDLYYVNPPLSRYPVGLSARLAGLRLPISGDLFDSRAAEGSPVRQEFTYGAWLRDTYRTQAWLALRIARSVLAGLTCTGVIAMYLWGCAVGGRRTGILAASFWALSPTATTWCGCLNPDAAGATAMAWLGCGLAYYWLTPSGSRAALLGGLFGLATATKFTVISALPALVLAPVLCRYGGRKPQRSGQLALEICSLLGAAYLALLAAYGVPPNLEPLGTYRFHSKLFAGESPEHNRFRNTWVGRLPALIPEEMLMGIDTQQYDLERPRETYIAGRIVNDPVRYWYLLAWLVKEPPATVIATLGFLPLIVVRRRRGRIPLWPQLLPGALVWVAVSFHGEFTVFYRYVLPALPAFWLAGAAFVTRLTESARPILRMVGHAMVGSLFASWLLAAPHWETYFSEAVGGPAHGFRWLAGWSLDWGQDIPWLLLRARSQPDEHPLIVFTRLEDPLEVYGATPRELIMKRTLPADASPGPARYAVGASLLVRNPERFTFLRSAQPAGHVGYSIFLWHAPPGDRAPEKHPPAPTR